MQDWYGHCILTDHRNTQAGIGTFTCNISIIWKKLTNCIQQCTEVLSSYVYNNNTCLRKQNLQLQVDALPSKNQALSLTIGYVIGIDKETYGILKIVTK